MAEFNLEAIGWSVGFALSGLLLMFLGLVLFDILTPFKIFDEVQNGNEAVAWLVTGFLVSTGIVLGDAFNDHLVWTQAMATAGISMLLNILGYYLWEWVTPRWSLNQAIKNGSTAAAKVCFGIFIAVGLVVAGSF
jgi:putative membrane protein